MFADKCFQSFQIEFEPVQLFPLRNVIQKLHVSLATPSLYSAHVKKIWQGENMTQVFGIYSILILL